MEWGPGNNDWISCTIQPYTYTQSCTDTEGDAEDIRTRKNACWVILLVFSVAWLPDKPTLLFLSLSWMALWDVKQGIKLKASGLSTIPVAWFPLHLELLELYQQVQSCPVPAKGALHSGTYTNSTLWMAPVILWAILLWPYSDSYFCLEFRFSHSRVFFHSHSCFPKVA